MLVGACNPIADPLLDGESDCHRYIGNAVKITRKCPTPPCQLGLCGAGIFPNCDRSTSCSKSLIDSDSFDIKIA